MKNIIKLLILPLLFVPFSCTDLKVLPTVGAVDNVIFKDPASYREYLAKIYAAFSLTGQKGPAGDADITIVTDEGFTSYIRAYWKAQELTTDESVCRWTDAGIRDLHDMAWSSENQFVRVIYYRIFYIIAYANDYLRQSEDDLLNERGIGADDKVKIKQYRAEARFLRALAYWHALDLFKNVPILTSITASLPVQSTPNQIFDFIESELKAIEGDMAAPMANEYGRADRAANWMLLAKLYLNAEVHIGTPKYTESITYLNKIFGAGYTLANVYNELFMADNDKERNTELIFTLPQDGLQSESWGSTTFLVHCTMGGDMTDEKINFSDATKTFPDEDLITYGVKSGWEGMRTTKSMVEKFSGSTIPVTEDPRAMFYKTRQKLEIDTFETFRNGYAVPKFKNIVSTTSLPGLNITHVDIDYPLFRLADAYLMYAEAVLRGGTGGDQTTALSYMNALRKRAYKDDAIGQISSGDLTLQFILDERSRELYWEGHRRLDLLRYGQFTVSEGSDVPSSYAIWPWKGGVKEGKLSDKYRNIFPIPSSDIISNPNLKQNPGY